MKLHKRLIFTNLILISTMMLISGCQVKINKIEDEVEGNSMEKEGSFGYDVNFIKKHYKNSIVLYNGESKVLITPELQGRVMTSTAEGNSGSSFGWINYDYITNGKMNDHFNPVGGEERFWLGPEGGQFSIFFKPESTFDFENWYVPKEIDIEPFHLISKTTDEALFQKEMKLLNYSNTLFTLMVTRSIRILTAVKAKDILGITIPSDIKMVGYESQNVITNMGENAWDKTTGMPSIWILSMLKHSDRTTVVVPFKKGEISELGKIVTDDYFGKVPADRLVVNDSVLFFKTDGNWRSKIGLSPKRALPYIGSYDPKQMVLTIAQFTLPQYNLVYVNSIWEIQDQPFSGDAVNAYNDGPMEDGSQLGPFYEIESSSPAARLESGESLTHFHRTFHFKGDKEKLDDLAKTLLNSSIGDINNAF